MIRLHVVVEGQTEETFVNAVLANHLGHFGVSVDARRVETGRRGTIRYKGGVLDYRRARKDLQLWMKEDNNHDSFFATMFDLYALPEDFPEFAQARILSDPYRRVRALEAAMQDDIRHRRFVPYIQLHEFEALLLADAAKLLIEFIHEAEAVQRLITLCAGFESPELIDDGVETAPSKRIIEKIPAYGRRKASAGPRIATEIGLPMIRRHCPHFDDWLRRLEGLGTGPAL